MATETKTERTLLRLYRNRGETEATKRLSADVQFVILETINGGHRVEADLLKLFPDGMDPGPCMGMAGMAFGINTVLGNEIAGKDKSNPMELATLIRERWQAISEDGEWSEGRQGPRIKDVLEAWAADAKNRGREVSQSHIDAVKSKLTSGEWTSKDLLDNAGINAEYQRIKAERAVAAYNSAKAAAAGAQPAQNQFDV